MNPAPAVRALDATRAPDFEPQELLSFAVSRHAISAPVSLLHRVVHARILGRDVDQVTGAELRLALAYVEAKPLSDADESFVITCDEYSRATEHERLHVVLRPFRPVILTTVAVWRRGTMNTPGPDDISTAAAARSVLDILDGASRATPAGRALVCAIARHPLARTWLGRDPERRRVLARVGLTW